MSNTEDCIFCNPAENALVLTTDDGIVVLDYPYAPGHVLVGTKSHVADLHEVAPDDAAAMMGLAARVSALLVERYGASKVYVAAIGDKDKHFHVHLLPKFADSGDLGPHVFGPDGWAKGAEVEMTAELAGEIRDVLSSIS